MPIVHTPIIENGVVVGHTTSRVARRPCVMCGAGHSKLCDFKLRGAKVGQTCDRPLCTKCAIPGGKTEDGQKIDYCPAHAEMIGKEKARQEQEEGETRVQKAVAPRSRKRASKHTR